jgi:hypothetical protein
MRIPSAVNRLPSLAPLVAAIRTAGAVISHPAQTLPALGSGIPTPTRHATSHLLPLTGLASLAAVIGMTAVGYPMPDGWVRFPLLWDGLLRGVLLWTFLTGGILLAGVITAALAPFFGGRSDTGAGIAATGYASVPFLAAYLLALFPPATPLIPLGGLYGVYLLSLAAPPFLGVPKEKARVFALLTAAGAIAVGIVGWVLYRLIANAGEF